VSPGRSPLSPGHHAVLRRDVPSAVFILLVFRPRVLAPYLPALLPLPDPRAMGLQRQFKRITQECAETEELAKVPPIRLGPVTTALQFGCCSSSIAPVLFLQCRSNGAGGCCCHDRLCITVGYLFGGQGLVPILCSDGPRCKRLLHTADCFGQQSPHQRAVDHQSANVPHVLCRMVPSRAPRGPARQPCTTSMPRRMYLGSTGSTHQRL